MYLARICLLRDFCNIMQYDYLGRKRVRNAVTNAKSSVTCRFSVFYAYHGKVTQGTNLHYIALLHNMQYKTQDKTTLVCDRWLSVRVEWCRFISIYIVVHCVKYIRIVYNIREKWTSKHKLCCILVVFAPSTRYVAKFTFDPDTNTLHTIRCINTQHH